MIIKNAKIVLNDKVIEKGYLLIEDKKIKKIVEGEFKGKDKDVVDYEGKIIMPGFVDVHFHGSCGIDFMDANVEDMKKIADALYSEGITTFLATTLTSDNISLKSVCSVVNHAKDIIPSLGGIHFEGPYINEGHKGAQNAAYIRNPSIAEFDELYELSGKNVRYITLAPEKEGSMEFIAHLKELGVTTSAGHSNASFADIEKAIGCGLTNTTHTHNAMSGYHHREPGIVAAAMYFDSLYTEVICDGIHVCPNTLKTFYKVVGPERFVIVTDALKIKHSDIQNFQLFGLDCVRKNGAAYLTTGPLAGSLLTMDQAIRNVKAWTNASLLDLAKISSRNAAKSINMKEIGEIKEGYFADLVILDNELQVVATYKNGERVFEK